MLRATINNSVKSLSQHRQSPTVALLAIANRRHYFTGVGSNGSLPWNWGFHTVPEEKAFVVERCGKYLKTLTSGLQFVLPYVDQVAYVHSLKEEVLKIPQQTAITKDGAIFSMDSSLCIKVVSPKDASYRVGDVIDAVVQLARTTMQTEFTKLTLEEALDGRHYGRIMWTLNERVQHWGIICLRCEIDITLPNETKKAMEMLAEATLKSRAMVLNSEGTLLDMNSINVLVPKKRGPKKGYKKRDAGQEKTDARKRTIKG